MSEEEATRARQIRDWSRRASPSYKSPPRGKPLTREEEDEAWRMRFLATHGQPILTPEEEEKAKKRSEAIHKALIESFQKFKKKYGTNMLDNNVAAVLQKRDDDAKLISQTVGEAKEAAEAEAQAKYDREKGR
jgi:hypothetical protein